MQLNLSQKMLKFLLVGAFGFAVDASIFYLLHHSLNVYLARLISFFIAVTVTWLGNRLLTFHSHNDNRRREWIQYTLVNSIGGAVNYFLFIALIKYELVMQHFPIIPLAISSGVAFVINFSCSNWLVFRGADSE